MSHAENAHPSAHDLFDGSDPSLVPAVTPGPWAVFDDGIYGAATGAIHGDKTCAECGHSPNNCGPAVVDILTPSLVIDIKNGHWDDVAQPSPANLHVLAAAWSMREALQRQVANIERWLATGVPADAVESKSIYEQMRAALDAANGEKA